VQISPFRACAGSGNRPAGPRNPNTKEKMSKYDDAVAAVTTALNDKDRATIGDPRMKQYKVVVQYGSLKEAFALAQSLALLGVTPRTTVHHDDRSGEPIFAEVNVYGKEAQQQLRVVVGTKLRESRREQLETLVLARGPIPDDILAKIWISAASGRKPHQIAEKMNELGIIEGMGGVRWTHQKVKAALVEYERRHGLQDEAA
jgi:hypothetical protein